MASASPAQARVQASSSPIKRPTFEDYLVTNKDKGAEMFSQINEITGADRDKIIRAFNNTWTELNGFNVESAIDWIFSGNDRVTTRSNARNRSGDNSRPINQQTPAQRPNSPNILGGGGNSDQTLVDLTESLGGGGGGDSNKEGGPASSAAGTADSDLEKAIQLSLQEHNSRAAAAGPAFGGIKGVNQEDEDVSRALEASLLESQGNGKRKRADNWIDPLNPHDRERNAVWPVGLKNVGQTCWFSAVIQSLFYLPAFRTLVFEYEPPSDAQRKEEAVAAAGAGNVTNYDIERQRKIVEFMMELRRLFALMVGTRRKYVDPTRAVDILRGSIGDNAAIPSTGGVASAMVTSSGGGDGSGGIGPATAPVTSGLGPAVSSVLDNNQQDVSEFTHIVLEWVEEAFKSTSASSNCKMEVEKENCEEKTTTEDEEEDISERDDAKPKDTAAGGNRMSKLFYGQVLIEGFVRGKEFTRKEAFGQWPLQVNSYTDIHESLEGSTAHELLSDSGGGSSQASQQQLPAAGQERWFTQLPPVLFLELSRFHYNTERKAAEKIHNRLDFPEVIYMDRYMKSNKNVTRQKREEVRALKERRSRLKEKLHQFSSYSSKPGCKDSAPGISLPDVLQLTADFATGSAAAPSHAGLTAAVKDTNMSSPSANPHQPPQPMDSSPCHSPKAGVTPAGSVGNVNDFAMETDVEMGGQEEEKVKPGSSAPLLQSPQTPAMPPHHPASGCEETNAPSPKSMSDVDDLISHKPPCPRHISESELRIIQSCLSRWKQEVTQDMAALETTITEVESKISHMYSDPSLQGLQYSLHAVMVHEGGVDSGHYWAYVRDHKRKVWLKFNDNTVNEASWEELVKESYGGHSNTSAYSLVYIDASKPDLLFFDLKGAQGIGETREDRMEEGDLEGLATTVPRELVEYVLQDNAAFTAECAEWDKAQELRKKQEALMVKKQQQPETAVADSSNDIEVVELLTHVHTHTKLSIQTTFRTIQSVCDMMPNLAKEGQEGLKKAIHKCLDMGFTRYKQKVEHFTDKENKTVSFSPLPPHGDVRLDSFIAYLMKNSPLQGGDQRKIRENLYTLALLEQLTLPGLESNSEGVEGELRKMAELQLSERRSQMPVEAETVRHWHQVYHFFRRGVHFFVEGVEAWLKHKFQQSLDHFTEAYRLNLQVAAYIHQHGAELPLLTLTPSSSISAVMLTRFLCLAVVEVNRGLIKQFQLGDCLNEVIRNVKQLVVPVLSVLQARSNANDATREEERVLEAVREEWCVLLGGVGDESNTSSTNDGGGAITDVLGVVLEPPPELSTTGVPPGASVGHHDKKREMLDQTADLKLAERYLEAAKKYNQSLEVNKENTDDNGKHVSFVPPSSSSQGSQGAGQQFEPSQSRLKPF